MKTGLLRFLVLFFVLPLQIAMAADPAPAQLRKPTFAAADWQSAGQSFSNNRNQPRESKISALNVSRLKVKWIFTTGGDVSATPTVFGNTVYVPDWKGNLFAIRASDGQQIWRHRISEYNGAAGSISRVSPLILSNEIVIGDNTSNFDAPHAGANIIAVNPDDGAQMDHEGR